MTTDRLAAHLAEHYDITVEGISQLEVDVHRVDRADGPSWVARSFPSDRPIEVTEGDAAVLRFLEDHDFPAERCAHSSPVSDLGGSTVLVTALVAGANGRHDRGGPLYRAMGDRLGRLQTLPAADVETDVDTDVDGAVARPAGSWHHLSLAGGGRGRDVAQLVPELDDAHVDELRDELLDLDLLDDLPTALLHPDFTTANAIVTAEGPVLVDWTGAGRGPRLAPLGWLLSTASSQALVDAVVAGYRPHVDLEPDELERLEPAIRGFGLILDCWMALHFPQMRDHVLGGRAAKREETTAVAARARAAF